MLEKKIIEEMNCLKEQIIKLEIVASEQEITIDKLNKSLIEQQFVLFKLEEQIQFLVNYLKQNSESNIAKASEETPPPHY